MSKKQKVDLAEWEKNVQACAKALKLIMKQPAAGVFLEPVDWKGLGIKEYPKIVKKPMDLGTVQKKLEAGKYAKVEELVKDVQQIWINAKLFNAEGSDIYDVAMLLAEEFSATLEVTSGPLRGAGGGVGPSSSGGELTQAKSVLKELCKHKDAAVFLEPVDWKTLELHDYPLLVKKPMDLGTVQKRLNAGGYASMMDVAADVNLVWSNAMTYNQDGSPIYQLAAALKAVADRKMAPLLAAAGEAAPEVTFITFEMKKKRQEGAATLPGKDLYGMVMIVEDSCKRAIDQSNAQELELDIDSLDLPTFLKLDKYVQDSLARARKK